MPKNTGLFPGGTTSAHAENTTFPGLAILAPGNYLRARGEYPCYRPWRLKDEELPPRTRRIRSGCSPLRGERGTTSAHAENTTLHDISPVLHGNYLRARGEYHTPA